MKISIQEDVAAIAFCANAVVRPTPTAPHRGSTSDAKNDASMADHSSVQQFAYEKKIFASTKKAIAIFISTELISVDQSY